MADKTIGELPAISTLQDSAMLPVEQGGAAGRVSGSQWKSYAVDAVSTYVSTATTAATNAQTSATQAGNSATAAASFASDASDSADEAEASRQAIEDMGVASETLSAGSVATVAKTVDQHGIVTLTFGIPRGNTGAQGATGPQGPQGVQGPRGDTGTAVAVETSGAYYFNVDNDSSSSTYGHLFLTYSGDAAPAFSINDSGHLIWTVEN